jgi:hypothetical protein
MMSIDPVERWNLAISAGAVATSLAVAPPAFTTSLVVGAALEAANFRALRRSAQFLFWGVMPGQRAWAAVFGLRFSLLAIGICAALYFGADAAGLLIGLSLIMPATLIEAWRSRPSIDSNAPRLADDDPSWDRWNPWLARESKVSAEPDAEISGGIGKESR